MATYTAIADSEIDAESPILPALLSKMRDNPIAITEKAAGAPVLANSYVVRAMLATSTVSLAGSVSPSSYVNLTLDGYSFFPMIHVQDPSDTVLTGHLTDGADPDAARFSIRNENVSTLRTYDVDYRYITA